MNPIHESELTSPMIARAAAKFVLAVVLSGGTPLVAYGITFHTRALTGTDGSLGPGMGAGVRFSSFVTNSVVLNSVGQTAFGAEIEGDGISFSNDTGVWLTGGTGGAAVVVREGDDASAASPGAAMGGFARPLHLLLNDSGKIAFRGGITGTGISTGNSATIWSEGTGGLQPVARAGGEAPGTSPGVTFILDSSTPAYSNGGHTAFFSRLAGNGVDGSNTMGIWADRGGSLELVARQGNAAPGAPAGVRFDELFARGVPGPVINEAGETAFWATLAGVDVTTSNEESIWTEGAGRGMTLLAREGAQAPGMPPDVLFSGFRHRGGSGRPVMNDLGQTAFFGRVRGPGSFEIGGGIWSEGGGTLHLVARGGEPAPGTAAGVTLGGFNGDSLAINSAGLTAFGSSVNGPGVTLSNRFAIWMEEANGDLKLVARQGELAPGAGPGIHFGNLEFVNPLLNGIGQVAFQAALAQADGTAAGSGIFATDLDGALRLVVREGDLFDVNDDPLVEDLRRILSADMVGTGSGGEDGLANSFSDAGQLAFRLGFLGGSSGIFVATIVPEPSTAVLLILSGAMMMSLRRQHQRWRCTSSNRSSSC